MEIAAEGSVLEHYHNINSVCAQKVRIALREKRLEVKERLLTLRGDQHDPAYRKLNPNGVVPTLVHDGKPIIESSLILYYLDEAFPRTAADAAPAASAPSRADVQQADRRIRAQFLHDPDLRHGVSAEFSENAPRGLACRDQQDAAQAPRRI
jgi:glutathione S-transferase